MTDPDGTYTVAVKLWSGGLELHVDGVGVTQAHNLDDAEDMARDLIERRTGRDQQSFSLDWTGRQRLESQEQPCASHDQQREVPADRAVP